MLTYQKYYENKQLADKVYFNTEKLSSKDKNFIYSITNGDFTTKFISDIYFRLTSAYGLHIDSEKLLYNIHEQLINYDKNVFPIEGFDITDGTTINHSLFNYRKSILDDFKKLPSIAIRNLKTDIRKERTDSEFAKYSTDLSYFIAYYSLLDNKKDLDKTRILQKIFKSNMTLDKLLIFVEDKQNLLGGFKIDRNFIDSLIDEYDIVKVFDENNVIVLEVSSPEAIKEIGCNSLWCFTYGEKISWRQWRDYSYNDIVYVIIDLKKECDDEEFMFVLIKPLEDREYYDEQDDNNGVLFNMSNEDYYPNPFDVLNEFFDDDSIKQIFTF